MERRTSDKRNAALPPERGLYNNKPLVPQLRSKYAEKPWKETLQLVRRCMDKPKGGSKSSLLFLNCLGRLHEALNVSSLTSMVSRLEMIAKQRGLGSHLSPTETTCYLTSDMFYLEVLLLPGGGVEDVKVAHHGEAPVSCDPLLKLLRSKEFDDFSMKLDCLSSLYNIPGDDETKIKVYAALQHLETDLLKISQLPRSLIDRDLRVDMVLNGRIGNVTLRREGNPLSIQYYISPYDRLAENANGEKCNSGQVALLTAGPSDSTHRLQKTSLIPKPPEINSQGLPVFSALDNVTSEVLPACFFLKLQPPLPMLSSFINKVHQITELNMRKADLQWLPLPRLLETSLRDNGHSESWEGEDAHFLVPLPENQTHGYVLTGDMWDMAALKGALVHSVPFTHPAHIPALLELLRHQAALNTLLASCITCHRSRPGSELDLHCEVLPESESSFSVSFPLPDSGCLGVLLVNLKDSHQITSRLFTPYPTDPSIDAYISRVLKRCMSIPLVMRAVCRRLARKSSSVAVASTLAAENDMPPTAPAVVMGANNGKQYGSEGKGSSSISSDVSSSTDHTPTKAPKNAATSEDSDLSMRTLSTPSPALIMPPSSSLLSLALVNGRGSSSSSVTGETVAMVHSPPSSLPCPQTKSRRLKDQQAPIDLLPDHAFLQIFSHLPTNQLCRCARVCHRWYNLAWDPRLWRTIRLAGDLLNADRSLRVLTRRLCQDTPNVCLMLETVVVSGCRRLTDRGLHMVAQCCPELRRLEVAGCYNVSNEAVFEVVSRCPNLEHLDVSGCSKVTCISLTREVSVKLSPMHGQQISIRYLDMTDCFALEDEGLHTIAAHCTQLTHLYLRRCVRLTDEALRYLVIYCPAVRELSVSDCRFVSDFGLREIAKLEGRLRYLSVAHCGRITDVGLRYVAKYCSRLRYLNARGCEGLTDHGLEHLAKNCPKLKSLDIGKCPLVSDAGLELLALNCFNLKRLSLKSCESITGRGLQVVAANCFDLQLLNVQDCDVPLEALRFVKRHCKRCIIEHTNPAFF
ncbi:hypothetical protein AAFF_G00002000 [Aldrovandia affinis]|uniref:Mediator of RNA polymerase II transcription subunit 1 n=1 Tax=Aldrovandia affinis TaxID=143900 RepID=A0AAD7TEJ3_9TELE|nr:hypothetical protein AAFF_G00002000 [Aldrovandia affinis]